MTVKSRRGQVVGASMALFVPVSYWILSLLVVKGIAPYAPARSLLDVIGSLAWASLFLLGPVGILIAARSAGVRGASSWVALLVVALPAYVLLWFLGVASLSGALGNPF